jgi:hypothetical protein
VGPDLNDQIEFSAVGLTARNVTLRRLIAEAYNVQPLQVLGERWLQDPTPTTATGPAMASNNPVPVLDKTELSGLYDFRVDTRPELDTDGFTSWKRVLEEQLGLKLNSRRVDVSVIVVDNALRIPTPN